MGAPPLTGIFFSWPSLVDQYPTHWLSGEDIPLIKSSELVEFELFNLKTDLAQTTNVAKKNRKQFEKMKAEMVRIHKEIVTEGEHWDIPADYKKVK